MLNTSPAKKINPASISAQSMLAGPRKLATQPIQPAFFIFKCLLTLDSSMISNLASIFWSKMLAGLRAQPRKLAQPALQHSQSCWLMLAGPQKLATQPTQPAFFIFTCLLMLDSSPISNLASIFWSKMLAGLWAQPRKLTQPAFQHNQCWLAHENLPPNASTQHFSFSHAC